MTERCMSVTIDGFDALLMICDVAVSAAGSKALRSQLSKKPSKKKATPWRSG